MILFCLLLGPQKVERPKLLETVCGRRLSVASLRWLSACSPSSVSKQRTEPLVYFATFHVEQVEVAPKLAKKKKKKKQRQTVVLGGAIDKAQRRVIYYARSTSFRPSMSSLLLW